jgi:hypothetical protein
MKNFVRFLEHQGLNVILVILCDKH